MAVCRVIFLLGAGIPIRVQAAACESSTNASFCAVEGASRGGWSDGGGIAEGVGYEFDFFLASLAGY